MLEQQLDIWSVYGQPGVMVGITTNGTVKDNGRLVMGRGVAKQAKDRIKDIDRKLGTLVLACGNTVILYNKLLFTFPVKHNWWEQANLPLIDRSANSLNNISVADPLTRFYLPRPGCGNGRLDWKDVKPLLVHLPDNVIVVNI